MHEKAPGRPRLGGRRTGAGAGSRGLVREPGAVRPAHVHAADPATLFTIVEADVTASALRATRQLVTGLIGRELRREELPPGTSGDLGQREVAEAVADQIPDGGLVGAVVSASCLSRRVSAA